MSTYIFINNFKNMNKIIWLVRHSIRQDATTHIPKETDCSITSEGLFLAKKIAGEIQKLHVNKIDKIYCSPYRRTIETSYAFASVVQNPPLEISHLISEVISADYTNNDIQKLPQYLTNYLTSSGITYPETNHSVNKRCTDFLNKMQHDTINKNSVIITHGGIINKIINILYPNYKFVDTPSPSDYVPHYCDYVGLELHEGTWRYYNSNWLKI